MNITFTLIIVAGVLAFLLYAVSYKAFGYKKEIQNLKTEIEKYKENLVKYLTELALIHKNGNEVQKEIENAQTEEEIIDILGNIVNRNNNRVSDNKTKK